MTSVNDDKSPIQNFFASFSAPWQLLGHCDVDVRVNGTTLSFERIPFGDRKKKKKKKKAEKRCQTPDLESASVGEKCGAVDCAEKYFGTKDVFVKTTGRCEPAPTCFFDEKDLRNSQVV